MEMESNNDDDHTFNVSWWVVTGTTALSNLSSSMSSTDIIVHTQCLILVIGLLYIALVLCQEVVVTFRVISLNLVEGLLSCIIELWKGFNSFLQVLCDALREVWHHTTRDNMHFIVANGILVYVLPGVLNRLLQRPCYY
jgi:hypothetical protein